MHSFYADLQRLMLKQSDVVFKLCSQLFNEMKKVNHRLIDDKNGFNSLEVIDITSNLVCDEIARFGTIFKRKQLNFVNPIYVTPREKALRTRLEMLK